jgi:hypothetical protein
MTPTLVTDGAAANDQLLYFTSSSLSADDHRLVFISDRSGHPNLYVKTLPDGAERALTFNDGGTLKSYVYFNGNERRGFGKASVSFEPRSGTLYYIQDADLIRLELDGTSKRLATIPSDQVTAFTHVSSDGRFLCVPTTDARALEANTYVNDAPGYNVSTGGKKNEVISDKPDYDIDARVQAENLNSYLDVYDTATGERVLHERVNKAWITHVQFHPTDPSLILYNHEWPGDCGIRRLWLWNGREHVRLRTEGEGRSRADWTCHEMWEADGRGIIYHGKYPDGVAFLGRVGLDGADPVEIRLPADFHRYGHFTAGNRHDNWLACDGYYHPAGVAENANWGGEWITLVKVDWAAKRLDWVPLCEHRSIWDCQDSHPHPILSHADDAVYFTSNAAGRRAVYRIAVPA